MRIFTLVYSLAAVLSFFMFTIASDRVVSVYYYPWYDTNRHWQEGYLRSVLIPTQLPQLGEYSNRSSAVINQHLDWSENFGIDNWICSWWGPNSWEDITIKNYISPQMNGSNITYCLFYESAGLLNLQYNGIYFDSTKIITFRSHFNYIATNYFSDPNYQRIEGKPVIYIYLTRTFSGEYEQAIQLVRQDMLALGFEIFLVGDEVYWGTPYETRISTLDAITSYNMHGPAQYAGYPSLTNFISDVSSKYAQFKDAAENQGVKFIPNVMPGFNDRAVRLQADHYIITNQFHPDSNFTSTLSHFADMADSFVDSSLNTVCITSFNEWHEDTQIEPTIVSDSTNNDQSGTNDYTQGYFYKGYGIDFLEVISNKFGTTNPVGIISPVNFVTDFTLNQNYPNPFNPSTKILYSIPKSDFVTLRIYNIIGREIHTLVSEFHKVGTYSANFDARKFSSGIYFYKLQVGNDFVETKKMLLIR